MATLNKNWCVAKLFARIIILLRDVDARDVLALHLSLINDFFSIITRCENKIFRNIVFRTIH